MQIPDWALRVKPDTLEKKILYGAASALLAAIFVVAGVLMWPSSDSEDSPLSAMPFRSVEGYSKIIDPNSGKEVSVPVPPELKEDKKGDAHVGVDMLGNEVAEPEGDRPNEQDMKQVSNSGTKFSIPHVGLNVPLGEMNEVSGDILPSNYTSAFWVRNKGVKYDDTEHGTTYIVTHALDVGPDGKGALAPGNFFFDAQNKKSRINPGDTIEVGGEKFVVDKAARVGKQVLPGSQEVWDEKKPHRLIVITCFPTIGDVVSNDNFVVSAHRV